VTGGASGPDHAVGAEVAPDARDAFIRRVTPGGTFCDVGGLWGTVKEKVSLAVECGASGVTMLDVTPRDDVLWRRFEERLEQRDVRGCRLVSGSIDDPHVVDGLGTFDVVHCSGVLYHCPNPLLTLSRLRDISRRWVIVTSMVVPEVIEGSSGELRVERGEMLLVPALTGRARAILAEHFERVGTGRPIGLDREPERWNLDDYSPWWWLYTAATLLEMTSIAGLRVVADDSIWAGRSHGLLADVGTA
jgi:hypothetical protein